MTIEALCDAMSANGLITLLIFLFPPLYALALRLLARPENAGQAPWRWLYAVLVYLTAIPGMFMAVVTAYQLFIGKVSLVKLDLLVYFLPIVSMIVTLVLIRARVEFKDIPGFHRLSGLLLMLGAAFAVAFIIDRLKILVIFHGSILWLFGIAGALFAIFKIGAWRFATRKKKKEITDL